MDNINEINKILEKYIDIKNIGYKDDLEVQGLDSLSTLKVLIELEEMFNIDFDEDEMDIIHFNTIESINSIIKIKLKD